MCCASWVSRDRLRTRARMTSMVCMIGSHRLRRSTWERRGGGRRRPQASHSQARTSAPVLSAVVKDGILGVVALLRCFGDLLLKRKVFAPANSSHACGKHPVVLRNGLSKLPKQQLLLETQDG